MRIDLDLMRNLFKTWAVAPVGERPSRNMIKTLTRWFDDEAIRSWTLIELWAGTGNLTRCLVEQWRWSIYTFEILDWLIEKLEEQFSDAMQVKILQEPARRLDAYAESQQVDCIVSTIPMTFLEDHLDEILEKSHKVLKPWGIFLMWQVRSSQNSRVEEGIGPQIYKKREWLSLPPVLVTAYQKQ